LSENELITLLKQGDVKAFEYLVNNNQVRIYNACLGVLRSAEDAEDVSQEVFVEVYRSIAGFKGESKLTTWMYRIAMTKSLDYLRGKKRKKRFAFVKSLFS
jgi:RNA polymerase sigma factor (sigma-70 family)